VTSTPGISVPTPASQKTSGDITINSPKSGEVISSGVVHISGAARGGWYSEAAAPFEIQARNKKVIAQSHIIAQGNWMTTDFVLFNREVTLTIPTGLKSGFIVFKNDNPSGDPAKDKEVRVPVHFK
jgi:hypothetical protein